MLRELYSRHDIVCTQDMHGTMADAMEHGNRFSSHCIYYSGHAHSDQGGVMIAVSRKFVSQFNGAHHHVFVDGSVHSLDLVDYSGNITCIFNFHINPSWTNQRKLETVNGAKR